MADTNAINVGYILEGGTTEDTSQFSASYTQLVDTPSTFPSGGGNYFAQPTVSGINFTLLEADLMAYDDASASISATQVQAAIDALDTSIQNNAAQLTPNADPTTNSTVAAAGAVMDGDFGSNGLMRRTGSGTYDTISTGLDSLTSGEVSQLQNIDGTTIATNQWSIVGGLDQALASTNDVTFNSVNGFSLAEQSSAFTIAAGSSTTRTLTVDADASVTDFLQNIVADTTPELGGDLNYGGNNIIDTNGKTLLALAQGSNAVNYWSLSNANTSNNPTFGVTGSDTDVGLNIQTKGSGNFGWNGTYITQNQWNTFISTMDQPVDTGADVEFNGLTIPTGAREDSLGVHSQIRSIDNLSNGSKVNVNNIINFNDRTMYVVAFEMSGSQGMATFFCDGFNNNVYLINNPSGPWSDTLGTSSSTNIAWDSGTSTFVIENNTGSTQRYALKLLTADS